MKKNAGFTLVELIVVIAILGILAGVAIPTYSGYIEKAKAAGDQQLLHNLNLAFAAACAGEGESNFGRRDVAITMGGTEGSREVTSVSVGAIENFNDIFGLYYEGGQFKSYSNLIYDMASGGFRDPRTAGTMTLPYGDGQVTVSGEAINALLNSTYYGEGMTSEKLLNQVNTVAKIAGVMGSVQNVMGSEGYTNAALLSLGLTPGEDAAENRKLLESKAQELALKEMGLTDISQITESNKGQYGEILQNISNNALVLYTAQSTTKLDAETAKGLLTNVNSGMIKDAMDGKLTAEDMEKGMDQAALAYGMYYAYVNSDACTNSTIKGNSNIAALDVIDALDNNKEFRDYMASEQGTKDMEAYLQALSVINSSTQSPEAVEKIVVEGFNDPDLLAILTQSMGK